MTEVAVFPRPNKRLNIHILCDPHETNKTALNTGAFSFTHS